MLPIVWTQACLNHFVHIHWTSRDTKSQAVSNCRLQMVCFSFPPTLQLVQVNVMCSSMITHSDMTFSITVQLTELSSFQVSCVYTAKPTNLWEIDQIASQTKPSIFKKGHSIEWSKCCTCQMNLTAWVSPVGQQWAAQEATEQESIISKRLKEPCWVSYCKELGVIYCNSKIHLNQEWTIFWWFRTVFKCSQVGG